MASSELFSLLPFNTNVLINETPHPTLPLKGGGRGWGCLDTLLTDKLSFKYLR
jgi:hypothetical protein